MKTDMILTDTFNLKLSDYIIIRCDRCASTFTRTIKNHNQRRKATVDDVCNDCSRRIGAAKRPQNSRTFLAQIVASDAYRQGILNRPSIKGENNPQWGKSPSADTRAKMSRSRTGKIGIKATAWKGGKLSLTQRIKTAIQRRYKWFHRVIDRDGHCINCGATTQLDAHHKVPVKQLIRTILTTPANTDENFTQVITHPLIVDEHLTNGVTLCRQCHKQEHKNWGSHEPKV